MSEKKQEESLQAGQGRLIKGRVRQVMQGLAGWFQKVNWLRKTPWAAGTIIYGWLIFATLTGYSYQEFNWEKSPNFVSWIIFIAVLLVLAVLVFIFPLNKENAENKKNDFLEKTLWSILPAFYLLIAVTTLTLVLMTYQSQWLEARQGVATIFASMFAAVGVVVSMVVSYKNGEESRILQHDIEEKKRQGEQNKQDAEIIKSLNDRMHEILSRRYSKDENERSASYFQLATLYQDWEKLAASSEIVRKQKNSQQKNILKILFGVPQKKNGKLIDNRTVLEAKTLDSIVQDIFPKYNNNLQEDSLVKSSHNKKEEKVVFDLSFLDLRKLSFLNRDLSQAILAGAHAESANLYDSQLSGANLQGAYLEWAQLGKAHLENANLCNAHLKGANLWDAHLNGALLWFACLEDANLWRANLQGVDLRGAHLEGAHLDGVDLRGANLHGVDLRGAHLEGANLRGAHLEGANLRGAHLEDASFFVFGLDEDTQATSAREGIINQLKEARYLPNRDELLKAKDFDQALVDDIIKAHKEHHKGDQQ